MSQQQQQKVKKSQSLIKFYEKIIINILKLGDIPNHVAFIMDGNRRFAQKKGLKKSQGHQYGLTALKRILEWSLNLGIQTVTAFAFAIENYNRDAEEISVLMDLAKENLVKMSQNSEFFQEYKVKVVICGNLELCPPDVKQAMLQVMDLTKNNDKLTLNICFSYNSSYEVENAVQSLKKDAEEGILKIADIKFQDLVNKMLIKSCPDIVIRTSNEIRLSNFLTFQSPYSQLYFLKESWPEIGIYSFMKIILQYQLNEKPYKTIQQDFENDLKIGQRQN